MTVKALIRITAIVMVLSQLVIGALYLSSGDRKQAAIGILLGIVNTLIFMF